MSNKSEFLLVSAQSESPYSSCYIDPTTGHALWSHKGNELRGSAANFAEPVGRKGEVILVGSASQNLVAIVSPAKFQPISCFVRSPVDCCAVDSTGTFAYLCLQNKIFTYNIRTGELVKISSNSMLRFNRILLCPHNKYMAVPSSDDGTVFIFQTRDLVLRSVLAEETTPFKTLRHHRLPATDLAFGPFDSTRLLTVSSDQSVVLWSIKNETPVLKINVDEGISACGIDAMERRIYLGTESGKIISISADAAKFQLSENDFLRAQSSDSDSGELQIVKKHFSPVLRIALNLDESTGASGDKEGVVYIWDAFNLQTMFKVQKAGPISTLRFVPPFKSVTDSEYVVDTKKVKAFQREMNANLNTRVYLDTESGEEWNNKVQELMDWMKTGDKPATSTSSDKQNRPPINHSTSQSAPVPLKSLSKSARRRLTKQKRQNPEEPDIMEVDEPAPQQPSSAEYAELQAELEKVKKMNEKLQAENKKLFEFAKKQLDAE